MEIKWIYIPIPEIQKFINPYTSDFYSFLSSNPNWDEVVRYLSKKFKVGYNSDAINVGFRMPNHAIDFFSNSTFSLNHSYQGWDTTESNVGLS